jgi:hypothetical protein
MIIQPDSRARVVPESPVSPAIVSDQTSNDREFHYIRTGQVGHTTVSLSEGLDGPLTIWMDPR